jgi:large subunit ribosomal protein L9
LKIILLEDVKGKGKKDQIITATDGYCTFLIRQNKALPATSDNLKLLEKKLADQEVLHNKNIEEAKELKAYLESTSLEFLAKITPRGTLAKKITAKDIAERLNSKFNSNIDKHKIELPYDLDMPGKFTVKIKLYNNILASIPIIINIAN